MDLSISTVSKVPTMSSKIDSSVSTKATNEAQALNKTKHSIEPVIVGPSQDVNEERINERIDAINKKLEKQQLETSYQRHEATNRLVIRLVDKETKEVVKEIPPEKLLDYAAGMDEILGLFVDKKA